MDFTEPYLAFYQALAETPALMDDETTTFDQAVQSTTHYGWLQLALRIIRDMLTTSASYLGLPQDVTYEAIAQLAHHPDVKASRYVIDDTAPLHALHYRPAVDPYFERLKNHLDEVIVTDLEEFCLEAVGYQVRSLHDRTQLSNVSLPTDRIVWQLLVTLVIEVVQAVLASGREWRLTGLVLAGYCHFTITPIGHRSDTAYLYALTIREE